MLINERFKSPNKEFEKVFNLFRKKDYFDEKSQVKKKQEEFVRFLKKGDPMATKVFKQNKEDMKSSLSFIEDMVMDYNKKNHFEAFQIFSKAVNNIEMKDSKSAEKSGNFIKSKIHNNSQKYSLAIYSAIRKQKFNNYKDVHKDVDELISKNESVKEATFRPNSGTMSGGSYGLDKRKYELKRDVKGVQIGDYTNVTLPKGTIIYNLPGGVFAHHRSLKSYEGGQNKYFNKPTFRGISIRREKNIILSIEKNSKILESVNEAKYKVGDNVTVTLKGGKKVYKGKVEKINPLKIRTSPSDVTVLGNHMIQSVVNEAKPKLNANQIMEKLAKKSKSFKDFVKAMYNESSFKNSKYWRFRKDKAILDWFQKVYNSVNESVPQGYNPMVEDKKQIKDLVKKVKHEKLFYDVLNTMEKKFGKNKYRIWLEKSLKGFGVNPKHYDYRTNAGAEEKLFQLGK